MRLHNFDLRVPGYCCTGLTGMKIGKCSASIRETSALKRREAPTPSSYLGPRPTLATNAFNRLPQSSEVGFFTRWRIVQRPRICLHEGRRRLSAQGRDLSLISVYLQVMLGLFLAISRQALRCLSFLATSAMESLAVEGTGATAETGEGCGCADTDTAGMIWIAGEV